MKHINHMKKGKKNGKGAGMMVYPEEGYAIRGAVYEVQRVLGAGFPEAVYKGDARGWEEGGVRRW